MRIDRQQDVTPAVLKVMDVKYLHGFVRRQPRSGAEVDVWHASPVGL